MKIERILALLDFSEGSDAALSRAVAIAQTAGAELVLLHASGASGTLPEDVRDAIARAAGTDLARCVETAQARGVDARAHLHPGSPSEAFAALQREVRPHLIVIGARGHSNLRRLWLGSVAEHVVHEAVRPVLVVRDEKSDATVSPAPYHSVLWATDFAGDAAAALEVARALAAGDAEWHAAHAVHLAHVPELADEAGYLEAARAEARRRLERVAAERGAEAHLVEGRAARAVTRLARTIECDLVAVGAIGADPELWRRAGSVALDLVRRAPCSVLVGRESVQPDRIRDHLATAVGALSTPSGAAPDDSQTLGEVVAELRGLLEASRTLEDEWLDGLGREVETALARIEIGHPRAADALARALQLMARMGI